MAPRNLVYSSVELTPDEDNAEQLPEEQEDSLGIPSTTLASPEELAQANSDDGSKFKTKIVWRNVILIAMLHIVSVYSFLFLTWKCRVYTLFWGK